VNIESGRQAIVILFLIIQECKLGEFSVAANLDVLLPVEFMFLDPTLVEWIVV